MNTAKYWIESLRLQSHPEGGYYRETYRSLELITRKNLPHRFSGDRAFSTAIYYLLQCNDFSAFHRIKQDEVLHFYDGTSLSISVINPAGDLSTIRLGQDVRSGEVPLAIIPAGCIFGSRVDDPGSYALLGCTVAPGFDFADFDILTRQELLDSHPRHRAIIEQLTR